VTRAIVVPVHGALPYVERLCHRLDLYSPAVPVVVVDDGSDPETALWLDRWVGVQRYTKRPVALLTNARQQLFTRTVNRGLRFAYREWQPGHILVLNSDVELLHPAWLDELLEVMRPGVGIAGYPDSPDGTKPLIRVKRMPEYVTGHCIAFATRMLAQVGVLCETDTTGRDSPELAHIKGQAHIGSERILGYRANAAGWQALEYNAPYLRHAAGKSWNHDLSWLASFDLQPLWTAHDGLDFPPGWTEDP
jgi:glycosyltransferase involved in cell wall biosynthesis